MRVVIDFTTWGASFEDDFRAELAQVLKQAGDKVMRQLDRPPCACTAPEAADKLLDINGNTIGSVEVHRGP